MSTRRQELGRALWRLADRVQVDERSRSFRAKAYRRAVWSLDDLSPHLDDPPAQVLGTPGIGPGVLKLIEEFRSEGRLEALDRLSDRYPEAVAKMRRLPRMTAAILRSLKQELGVDEVSDLLAVIESGGVETLRGVGLPTAERWREILELTPKPSSVPSFQATGLADALGRHLERHVGGEVWVAGSVRRLDEWVDELDLVLAAGDPDNARELVSGTAVAHQVQAFDPGPIRMTFHNGLAARIHLAQPSDLGRRLLIATGPPEHVRVVIGQRDEPASTEAEVYVCGGLDFIAAPARELPLDVATHVIQIPDLRGDLHVHTDWSPDGRMSLEVVLAEVVAMGYDYVLITDHTKGLRFGGLDEERLSLQRQSIDAVRDRFPDLTVLHGAELNVDRTGELDIGDDALALLDLAVVGLHSNFDLDRAEQTSRVLTVLEHPAVRILAHPTGRRIGIRPAIDLD
ncbi:MAG: PHP domain-containing protein, partial [Acidimicrobiia bacterium]